MESATGRALDRAGISAGEIGGIVVVSTTGIATPSLDALLIDRMHLPATVQRLPIFGLGCAGGVIGLARAATIAASMPDKAVLLLVVELCSLTFRRGDRAKSNMVAAALFGDGAAAVLLRCGGDGPAVIATGEHTWPQTLDIMGWEVAEDGLKPVFSRDIPRLVAKKMGAAARDFLGDHGLRLADIDRFVCHPGGPKVIDALEDAFGLGSGVLSDARAVLRDYGNMSAASVLFVLGAARSQESVGPCTDDGARSRFHRRLRGAESRVSILYAVLGLVLLQRAAELGLAAMNTRHLRAQGAVEFDARGYPWFVLLHGAWIASLFLLVPPDAAPSWPLLGVFAALQLGRLWVIATLGRRWTTRIIVLPGAELVDSGPYRYLRHPNYAIVAGEIAVLPLAFDAAAIALVFSAA